MPAITTQKKNHKGQEKISLVKPTHFHFKSLLTGEILKNYSQYFHTEFFSSITPTTNKA